MKILFDLSPIFDHLTGIERFAINIAREIIISHPENKYIIIFKNEVHSTFVDIVSKPNVEYIILKACHKLFFIQWRLMKCLLKCKADRYVFLSFNSPWLFRSRKIINTIHDLSAWDCPETRKWYMTLYGKIGIKNAVHISKEIVTVSNFSRNRIINQFKIDKSKVHVVYNGVSEQFLNTKSVSIGKKQQVIEKYKLPSNFLMCLATLEPRKNMKLLIEAYLELKAQKAIDYTLVLAGRKGWKLEDAIGNNAEVFKESVRLTGFIDDDDLPILYSLAKAFVFPSIYEGFGIPVIEAMSCGTTVICSDSSSLPEVVCDAGILFKNKSKDSLKEAILKFKNMSNEERSLYLKKGFYRSLQFSWKEESENLYKIIVK